MSLRRAATGCVVGLATLALLVVGIFDGIPLLRAAAVLVPVEQPTVAGGFGCDAVDAGPPTTISGVSSSVVAVQTGRLRGFERLVVYFAHGVPHYHVETVRPPVFATRPMAGDAFDVRLQGD